MRFTKSLSLAAISAAIFALLGPPPALASKRPRYGGTLRVELSATSVSFDPRSWKPGSPAAGDSEKLAALLYDRLVTLDDYGRFQPALALEWVHDPSSKLWQFKLRPAVKFSDGSAVTAKDVIAALQPLFPAGFQVSPSESGVQIRAPRPAPDLLEQLASSHYFIFRIQPDGSPIGTGPFTLAENSVSSSSEATSAPLKPAHLKFRARDDAWSGRPFLDAIDVTLGNPPLRQVLDLQVGRADIVDLPPTSSAKPSKKTFACGVHIPTPSWRYASMTRNPAPPILVFAKLSISPSTATPWPTCCFKGKPSPLLPFCRSGSRDMLFYSALR